MSKQEIFDILYNVMETLPRELVLLIRDYLLFLPTTEEIRYFNIPCYIEMVPLTSECIILYSTLSQPLLLKDEEIIYRFHYADIHEIHVIARYNDSSFIIAHDTTLDQIVIKPSHPVKSKIMNFKKDEIQYINVDKDGYIIASGRGGILIILHGQIIQRFLLNVSCHLHFNNIVSVYSFIHYPLVNDYQLTKTDKYYCLELPERKFSSQIMAESGTFNITQHNYKLFVNSALIKSPISLMGNDFIHNLVLFQEKIYVLTCNSIRIFHKSLVVA